MVCSYVIVRCIFKSITEALGTTRLLALTKPSSGIQPIVVGEVFYRLVNKFFFFQFHDAFSIHLLSQP